MVDRVKQIPTIASTDEIVIHVALKLVLDQLEEELRQWVMKEFERYPNKVSMGSERSRGAQVP